MINIQSDTFQKSIEVNRIIDHIRGSKPGPTIIFIAGIHGNEYSSIFAVAQVFKELKHEHQPTHGNIYAIGGNLPALEAGTRYCSEDLNRIWTDERIDSLKKDQNLAINEDVKEQKEIYDVIQDIIDSNSGPFYFIDLHTTSSETIPFVVFSDSMINRKFAENFPLPLILGIEEYLDGALLSYYNSLGYISIGYEAGQHQDLASYENHMAFIYLCLTYSGNIDKNHIDYFHYYEQLAKTAIASQDVYEILFRFRINENDQFEMQRGFVNFQKVHKGQLLAVYNGNEVKASHTGRLFMPLYQNQGKEGFFEIRKIHPFLLRFSEVLRVARFDHMLALLPGIRWQSERKNTLIVNLKIARFFTKQFLHLLGYRSKRIDKSHLIIRSFETNSKAKDY